MSSAAPAGAVLILSIGWFALSIICGMLAEYSDRIIAALRFEPMPGQRYRAGQPVNREPKTK